MAGAPDSDYQVVVVGAGPTGLTCANLLGSYGVRTLLVERNATTVQEPRAVSIDDESLRTLQAVGAVQTVLSEVVTGYGSEYLTPSGRVFLKVEPSRTPYGFARRNAFRQPVLEAQLRSHLGAFPQVDTLFGWRLASFEQDEWGVALTVEDPEGGQREIRCAYLVAADGASSFIRETLGLTLDGRTFSEKWLIVDCEDSPAPSRETLVFCDVRRPCIALPGPARTRRFEFKLLPRDDPTSMVDPDITAQLLEQRGAAPGSRVVRRAVYTFHARVAPEWRKGRMFLAGDACHLTPPFAGQGMNSGLRDAHNLAWKLHWVLSGVLKPEVLDTYQEERRDHVAEMIRLALRMGRIMGPSSRWAGWVTQTGFRLMGVWSPLRDYFAQMKYKPAPRFEAGLVIPDGRSRRSTPVGRLLPQPTVETIGGAKLLDEVLGQGFALVGAADFETFSDVARLPEFEALQVRCIRIAPAPNADRKTVVTVSDASGALAHAARQGLLLVRPDRYVMASFAPKDARAISERLRQVLSHSLDRTDQPPSPAEPVPARGSRAAWRGQKGEMRDNVAS